MGFIDKLAGWKCLLRFELALGERNKVAVSLVHHYLHEKQTEAVGLWAFATSRILYEIWCLNPPRAFLALDFLARVVRQPLDPTTRCFECAELYHIHYAESAQDATESIIGEYLARGESDRRIRFLTPLGFDGNAPSALVMIAGVALLQHVVDRFREQPEWLRPLSDVARFVITRFGIEEWAGKASKEKLPRAALANVGLMPAQG